MNWGIQLKKTISRILWGPWRILKSILRLFFRTPTIRAYSIYLRFRLRLNTAGIHIKNPFTYGLVSKSIVHILIIIAAGVVIVGNQKLHEPNADTALLNPRNILYSYIAPTEEEALTLEEGLLTDQTNSSSLLPSIGVKASPRLAGEGSVPAPTELGTIAHDTEALIKPNLPITLEGQYQETVSGMYAVKNGDTISSIAAQFNITVNTLLWANGLGAKSPIHPGEKLVILPLDGILYTIKKGDTLLGISSLYNIDADSIVLTNRLAGIDDLTIGERLILPDAQPLSTLAQNNPKKTQPRTTLTRLKDLIDSKVPKPSSSGAPIIVKSIGSGMRWPTSANIISQYFGLNHTGIDIAGPPSNQIYAASDGVVEKASYGWNGGYGNRVVIDHGNGLKTLYGHSSKLLVAPGDHVVKGQVIAMVGNTGNVRGRTGYHLHFEVISRGRRVNPLQYVRQ